MPNKTDIIIDNIIKKIDKEMVYERCKQKAQIWNGEMSEKERIKELKEGTIF